MPSNGDAGHIRRVLENARSQSGKSIVELAAASPLLIVFLRHAGCPFCREALNDIAESRATIEAAGVRIVLVHPGDLRHNPANLDTISDPARELYRAFGLKRGSVLQLFGPRALWRALAEGSVFRFGLGLPRTDPAQMPGVFLISRDTVIGSFRHTSISDRPDYAHFCSLTAAAES